MIRQALPADVPAIVAAYDWLLAPPGVRPPDWSTANAADRLQATMADDRAVVLVADDNNTIVGFATVYLDIVFRAVWTASLGGRSGRCPGPPLWRDREGATGCRQGLGA
jgi:hypothetical protein